MIPATLDICVGAIEGWDGEDLDKLNSFVATIRATMNEPDKEAAYIMIQTLLQRDIADQFLYARLNLYSALSGPVEEILEYLEIASTSIASVAEKEPDNTKVLEWQHQILAVQLRMLNVGVESESEEEEEDSEDEEKSPAGTITLPLRPGADGNVSPIETEAATKAQPDSPTKTKRFLTGKEQAEAQIEQRITDQKRRQNLSKLPPSLRRSAANKSFSLGLGPKGTIKKAPSRMALFDLFKKQDPMDTQTDKSSKAASEQDSASLPGSSLSNSGSEEGAAIGGLDGADELPGGMRRKPHKHLGMGGLDGVDEMPEGVYDKLHEDFGMGGLDGADDEPYDQPSTSSSSDSSMSDGSRGGSAPGASSEGGGETASDEEGEPMNDLAAHYNEWVEEAGVVGQEEYDRLYAQHLEEMKAVEERRREERERQQEEGQLQQEEGQVGHARDDRERSMDWE